MQRYFLPRGNALVTIISFPKGCAFILTQHPLFISPPFSLMRTCKNHLLKAFPSPSVTPAPRLTLHSPRPANFFEKSLFFSSKFLHSHHTPPPNPPPTPLLPAFFFCQHLFNLFSEFYHCGSSNSSFHCFLLWREPLTNASQRLK